jgi:hypothetical protein
METSEDSRAEFEAWITAPPIEARIDRYPTEVCAWPGQYRNYSVQLAWEAWNASRKEPA